MHGSLEQFPNGWAVWCSKGYVTAGGFSPNPRKALRFDGPGRAIYMARLNGIAITRGILGRA